MATGWRFRRFRARSYRTPKRALVVVTLAVGLLCLVAGCASELPRPVPERSPLRQIETARVYFPLVTAPLNKFGTAGCTPSPAALGARWCYDWSPNPPRGNYESVPMIYAPSQIGAAVGGNSAYLLGFNEPDLYGQANVSPQGAVGPWAALEARFPDRKMIAPALVHNHDWLPQFRAAFRAQYGRWPRLDGLAVHCYAGSYAVCRETVERYVGWARAWAAPGAPPLEVWVTEFYFSSETEARRFTAWLDAEPVITRWSPYKSFKDCTQGGDHNWDCGRGGDPSLLTPDGKLTDMGRWYARPTPEW